MENDCYKHKKSYIKLFIILCIISKTDFSFNNYLNFLNFLMPKVNILLNLNISFTLLIIINWTESIHLHRHFKIPIHLTMHHF